MNIVNITEKNQIVKGNANAHFLGAAFLVGFGTWWGLAFYYRYFKRRLEGLHYEGTWRYSKVPSSWTKLHPRWSWLKNVPVESCLAVVTLSTQIVLAVYQGLRGLRDGRAGLLESELWHVLFYSANVASAALDICVASPFCCKKLPPHVDFWGGSAAFLVTGTIFATHIRHYSPHNFLLHLPTTLSLFAVAVILILESQFLSSVVLPFLRAACLIFLGVQLVLTGYMDTLVSDASVSIERLYELTDGVHALLFTIMTVALACGWVLLTGAVVYCWKSKLVTGGEKDPALFQALISSNA